jgi:Xaa-Pro aminopeptidase
MENPGKQWIDYNGQQKNKQFGLKSLRHGMELQPGLVLTIEPGIYFIPQIIDLWQKQKINTIYNSKILASRVSVLC